MGGWELARFGETTRQLEQRTLAQLTDEERHRRDEMRKALKYPPVTLNGQQALSIANGFRLHCERNGYAIWALSILPEHTHLVIARHRFKVEQMMILLKGAATRQLIADKLHPMAGYASTGQLPPHMWARGEWKVYLDSETHIENAIAYVIENPIKEGKPKQEWKWLTPYQGLESWTTYLV